MLGRRPLRERASSQGNDVRLLHDGLVAYPVMLEAIAGARREVLLEMYWFASDRTGQRFADALRERARAGVRVRVIYDAVGSLEADTGMFDEMRSDGCEVTEFHPIKPWRRRFSFAGLNRRTHRKLLVVDGSVGFAGGINIGDPWASEAEGGGAFRDDAVLVEGPAARDLRSLFFRTLAQTPSSIEPPEFSPEGGEGSEVTVLASDLRTERRGIRNAYLLAIRNARHDVLITNSYFIPGFRIRRALLGAVRRGVRVRVLMPLDSDIKAVQFASRYLYDRLLRNGVELYEWYERVLHAKTAVVDGAWCTVGSFNFDHRSSEKNLEVNVAIVDPAVAADLHAQFERDLAGAQHIQLRDWRFRPMLDRALEWFCFRFRWLL